MSAENIHSPESLIGKEAKEVVLEVLRLNPQISKLRFGTYFYVPRALKEVKQDVYFSLTAQEFRSGEKLQKRTQNLKKGWDIGICSRVILKDGLKAHIPMMDFKLKPSLENLQKIKKSLREVVGEKYGFILETECSYHYYGANLISSNEWFDFMAKCLLTSIVHSREKIEDLVDSRYIGHKLLKGECRLRLSNSVDKKIVPIVVDVL